MEQKKRGRGRPRIDDKNELRKRYNVSLLPEIQEVAKIIGGGNVSRGLELAIREFDGKDKTIRQ